MKKISQIVAAWPQLYSKLKTPPQGVNLGGFSSKLPPQSQIIFENQPNTENPQAIAYVSSGDNQDGVIDKIHVVVPRLEQEFRRLGITGDTNDPENLTKMLAAFVEILSHEIGHIQDFDPNNKQNPFPGNEPRAEQAAREALSQFSVQGTTNIRDRFNKHINNGGRQLMINILSKLNKLASDLDAKKQYELADEADRIARGMLNVKAEDEDWVGREKMPPQSSAEALPPEMNPPQTGALSQYDKSRNAQKGSIQPPGDKNYTYDYLPEEDAFIVRTAPPANYKAVGARLRKGTKAYKILEQYIPKTENQPVASGPINEDGNTVALRGVLNQFKRALEKNAWGEDITNLFKSTAAITSTSADFLNKFLNAKGIEILIKSPLELQELGNVLKSEIRNQNIQFKHKNKESLVQMVSAIEGLAKKSKENEQIQPNAKNLSDKLKKAASLDIKSNMEVAFGTSCRTPFGR